jgi:hypothetical protein
MVIKWKQFILLVLLIGLIITGCSTPRVASTEGVQSNNQGIVPREEQMVDVLETYHNKEYKFSFDIPIAWKDKYKVIQESNKISFVYIGWPNSEWLDSDSEIFAIMVMTEEKFKEASAEPPFIPEQDILGRKNNLVYFFITPLAVGLPSFTAPTNSEDLKKYEDEWSKLYRALNQIPKRFHFE